jgi:demethylmenaquinone methyltransferase/2-methoxy-6-polyprenyl-1,4-benzoquinol methylase
METTQTNAPTYESTEDTGVRRDGNTTKEPERAAYHQPGVLRVLQSKDETRAFYDKIAHVYDLLAEHSEAPVRQAGLHMLEVQPGQTVLEIGFGTGRCLLELAQSVGSNGKVYGIDLSEKMRDISHARLEDQGLEGRVELCCGDALHLPYPDRSMDGVFMSFTLELFDTPEIPMVLSECRRVLRTGGRIVVVGMSRAVPGGVVTEVFEWTHRHFPNYLDCRPILVRQALEDAGFRITESQIVKMWVKVEIVCGLKGADEVSGSEQILGP